MVHISAGSRSTPILTGQQKTAGPAASQRRVRVWFGEHLLHDYRADADAAAEYSAAIGRRFAGLQVKLDSEVTEELQPLPCEQLWTLTP